jgi:hypothetical protein
MYRDERGSEIVPADVTALVVVREELSALHQRTLEVAPQGVRQVVTRRATARRIDKQQLV